LASCLFEIPITIYTDEEKRTMLLSIARTSEEIGTIQAELSQKENRHVFLNKKLEKELKFLKDDFYLIYKRAKNYKRRN